MVTMIHIDDEDAILRAMARTASSYRPRWQWESFEPNGLEPIVEAVRAAVTRGDKVIYMTDRQIGPPFGTGENLWAAVWAALTLEERLAVELIVMACSSNGFEPLRTGIEAVSGGSIRIIAAPKPIDISAFFALLPL